MTPARPHPPLPHRAPLAARLAALDSRLWPLARGEDSAPWWRAALIALAAGPIYGLFMGSFAFFWPGRVLMMLYSAAKMPLLVGSATLLCALPFYVLHLVLGLRADFPAAVRAVVSGQASMALALASLAPLTRFAYFCGLTHPQAILFNGAMFALATAAGHAVMMRRYRPLIASDPRHRLTLWTWVTLYVFVGIQAGWMLRPFIGTPGKPVTFFRDEPFSNAYIVVLRLIAGQG